MPVQIYNPSNELNSYSVENINEESKVDDSGFKISIEINNENLSAIVVPLNTDSVSDDDTEVVAKSIAGEYDDIRIDKRFSAEIDQYHMIKDLNNNNRYGIVVNDTH